MHRLRFGSVLAAAALAAAAVIPMLAGPAGATTCNSGEYPATFAAQSGLKVFCNIDAGSTVNHVEIHDADNVEWHHGAARNVALAPSSGDAITAASATIKFAAGKLIPADVRRPINAFNAAKAAMFKGGTFITSVLPAGCTTACTSATISQKAALTGGTTAAPISAKIEHTYNRVLDDATCAAGGSTLTSATAHWVTADDGKSVSGGPFSAGTFISSVSGTVATLNQSHANACTATLGHTGDMITIGAATFSAGNPVLFNNDPMTMELSNTVNGGSGFTCAGSVLTLTAAAKANTGGFVGGDTALAAVITSVTGVVTSTTIKSETLTGNTSVTLGAACPAGGVAATGTKTAKAIIGNAGAGAPTSGAAMMTLGAELNLNPLLVTTQDDCAANTFEGFMVVGGWENPGTFTGSTATPPASVGEVLFPTSVISFVGFVVPQRGGDTIDANPHYNFSFPILPTGLAECLTGSAGSGTANPTGLTLGMNPVTMSAAPFLPTGSGNAGDPTVRQLLPETGSFSQTIQLLTASVQNNSFVSTACAIGAPTAAPSFTCGDG